MSGPKSPKRAGGRAFIEEIPQPTAPEERVAAVHPHHFTALIPHAQLALGPSD
jgi:hypothetical protein